MPADARASSSGENQRASWLSPPPDPPPISVELNYLTIVVLKGVAQVVCNQKDGDEWRVAGLVIEF